MSPPSSWSLLGYGLATTLLLYLAYLPVGWAPLAWFAYLPWLSLAALPMRPPRLYLLVWLATLPWGFMVLSWIPVADWRMSFAWLVLGLYTSVHFVLAFYLVRLLRRRLEIPFTFGLPLVWTALEYVRANLAGGFVTLLLGSYQHDFPGGFGWYLLGHTQHDFPQLIQVSDLGGAFLVSFVVAAVNGLLYETILARWHTPLFSRSWLLGQALLVSALLAATLTYGSWQLSRDFHEPGPRVALLQGNIDQRIRNQAFFGQDDIKERAASDQMEHYAQLSRLAIQHTPDLIIWPETAYPGFWSEERPGRMTQITEERAARILKAVPTAHLLGMNAAVFGLDGKIREFNSAVLIAPGKQTYLGRYDKAHRVPFGEYIPFPEWFSFLQWLAPYEDSYGIQPGDQLTRFQLGAHSFGVLICFEDTDTNIARHYHGVDYLVNISNDGWFDGTSEHDQHLATARFRAVELRRPLVRAVNMGISAVIDANGRVLRPEQASAGSGVWVVPRENPRAMPPAEWGRFKKVSCVVIADVPLDGRSSLYAQLGDAFSWVLWAVLFVLLLMCRWRPVHVEPTA